MKKERLVKMIGTALSILLFLAWPATVFAKEHASADFSARTEGAACAQDGGVADGAEMRERTGAAGGAEMRERGGAADGRGTERVFGPAEQIASLPKYDPREELTPVKDQGTTNLCWAYAAVNASEASILKDRLGSKDTLRLNPQALAYRKYVRTADPLGNNASYYSKDAGEWLSRAGQTEQTAALLSMWQGPIAGDRPQADVWENSLYRLESASLIFSEATGDERIAEIKQAIAEYGAVTASCYYDGGTRHYYNDSAVTNGISHAITLIGWDDNIDKELFQPGRVSRNGGWLVKNSYNDNGYFWLTYESNIASSTAWAFTYAQKDAYDYNYYYDNSETDFGLLKPKQAANVYEAKKATAERSEYIEAIQVGFIGNDVTVTVRVYTDLSGWGPDRVESGRLAAEQSRDFRYGGYHTVKLKTPVKITAGSYFSIVAEVSNTHGDAGVRTIQTESKKPSFQKTSSGYDTILNGGAVARIKAYTKQRDAHPDCTEHHYGAMIPRVAPTCSAAGMEAHYLCTVCGKYFDESKTEKTVDELTILVNPNAHDFGAWIAEVPATCVATGTKGHQDCSRCNKHYDESGNEITDLTISTNDNHDWNAWVSNLDGTHTRTCKRDSGHTEDGACSGGAATCTKKAVCAVCKTTYGGTAPHITTQYGDYDNTGHWDTCSTCDNKLNFEAHTPDREKADETNPVKCAKCGFVITPAGHYEHTADSEWHNSADGKHHYHKCTHGGCSVILDKADHAGGTATCKNKAVCSVCGVAYGEKLGHDYGEVKYTWTSDNTCKAERVCKHDSAHIESETVTATGTTITAATCKEKGKMKYTATFVNTAFSMQEKEVDIDFAPHTFGAWKDEIPATTEDFGTKGHKDCTVCGKHFDKDGGEITDLRMAKIGTHAVITNGESKFYKEGESVTVTAEEQEGKVFKGWKDASGKIVSTKKEYTFKVEGEKTLTAVYDDMPSGGGEITPPAKKDGLSGGAIAGIVIGSVAVAGLGGFSVFWFAIRKKSLVDLLDAIKEIFEMS